MTGVPASLGYTKSSSLLIEPYPSYDWHSSNGRNCDGITSVFRVAFDECNQMWVLDTGKIGSTQYCQPQLLIFNLISDKLVKRYRFDRSVYMDTSLFITPVSINICCVFKKMFKFLISNRYLTWQILDDVQELRRILLMLLALV